MSSIWGRKEERRLSMDIVTSLIGGQNTVDMYSIFATFQMRDFSHFSPYELQQKNAGILFGTTDTSMANSYSVKQQNTMTLINQMSLETMDSIEQLSNDFESILMRMNGVGNKFDAFA